SAPGESRRALYERARAALIAQLRSVEPPLSESEITRERLSLEEAVRKVESEAAQRARDATRSGEGSRPGSRAGDAVRGNHRPAGRPGDGATRPRPQPPSSSQPRNERPPLGQDDSQDQRPRNGRPEGPRQPQGPMQDPVLAPNRGPRRGSDPAA